jgi:hypothetical protein
MTRDLMRRLMAAFLLYSAVLLLFAPPAAAANSSAADEWEFDGNLYVWMPQLDIVLQNGGEIDISFNEIIKNLEGLLMGGLGAKKDKWSFKADVIYFKIEGDEDFMKSIPFGLRDRHDLDVGLDADVTIEAWIVTPSVGYNLIDTEKGSLDVFGGARYLWIDVPLKLKTEVGPLTRSDSVSTNGEVWDGIVGVRGQVNLAPKWYAQYYLDGGAGESKSTWQGYVGGAYRFKKVDAFAGYRYLNYKFKDSADLHELTVKGPQIGVKWVF